MRRLALLAPLILAIVLAAAWLLRPAPRRGTYRKAADTATLARWREDYETKRALVPDPPPPSSPEPAPAFSGTFRFGPYDYPLVIEQDGARVVFRSGGVDRQDIGGAWETVGEGFVSGDRLFARWWCFDLTRNYANNGGCEMWFADDARERLEVEYYHDSDRTIEEGFGVRAGTHEGERLEYRIRVPHPVTSPPGGMSVRGRVTGRDGEAIADAVVMVRADPSTAVRTDGGGRWTIVLEELPTVLPLAAGARGYRNGAAAILKHRLREVDFILEPSPAGDHAGHAFVDPDPDRGTDLWRCGNCHRNSYTEWRGSRHARTADNAVTRAVYERDFLPALARGEARGDPGLCAACHAPSAAVDDPGARLDGIDGVHRKGNHCDFCHKVHHVEEVDRPGVRGSLRLGRPAPGEAGVPGPIGRVYGPLADSDYLFMGPVHNPLFTTSVLCAGCHQYRTADGIPALDTYAEWAAWSAETGDARTCGSCHMPAGGSREGDAHARRIAINALRRPPEQIHPHDFRGRELAPRAVALEAEVRPGSDGLWVHVTVGAGDVGHRIPTGSADKHLLLTVRAEAGDGTALPLLRGPLLPAHAGEPLAGTAGREFAQVLADAAGRTHVPFWRATRLVEDTRLRPGATRREGWLFAYPQDGVARVRIEVRHRLRFGTHDVAGDVTGPGVRPLDLLVAEREIEVKR